MISNYKYMVYIHILHIHVYMYCTSIYCQNPPSLTSLPKTSKARCRASNRLTSCGHDRDCGNVHVCAPGFSTGSKHQLGENECSSKMFLGLQPISLSLSPSLPLSLPLSLSLSLSLSFVLKVESQGFGAKWFSWYNSSPSLTKPLREVGALSGNFQNV